MTRALVLSTVALGLITVACNNDSGGPGARPVPGTGGGTSAGGSGGSTGGSGGSGGSGGAGGSGGVSGSGGSGGSTVPDAAPGGSGGTGGGSAKDGPAADAPKGSDGGGGSDADPGGNPYPGKAAVRICPKDWNQMQCCAFLCACVTNLCSDSVMDKGRIPGCMSMCMGLSDMRARCQVYHCYESKSPSGIKDHDSHCGHATGRVGGGGCPAAIYQ
jgi:hypothetical protein